MDKISIGNVDFQYNPSLEGGIFITGPTTVFGEDKAQVIIPADDFFQFAICQLQRRCADKILGAIIPYSSCDKPITEAVDKYSSAIKVLHELCEDLQQENLQQTEK